ncbi:hypothetical protein CSUB01_12554 [Colletotrichum sublineola]|uniref:Uncharacterized protein n=1 Tax=Colletotrichum sublineola TaxID=1173701 RepID=A0A066X1B1_COLSU|nr:hypothetical protein CSUB01_12554 [Colletotrichum sublineola]
MLTKHWQMLPVKQQGWILIQKTLKTLTIPLMRTRMRLYPAMNQSIYLGTTMMTPKSYRCRPRRQHKQHKQQHHSHHNNISQNITL